VSAQLAVIAASECSPFRAVSVIAPAEPARSSEFIVDAPAKMLRRNEHLSKNARRLYLAMRSLADGSTGELRNGDRWYRAEAIDAAAEMCRDIRMRCMRELASAGLVTFERERIVRKVRGRYREVLGRSRYTVHHSPAELSRERFVPAVGKTRVLLQSISSTVEEIDSQVFSKTPETAKTEKAFSHPPLCGKVKKSPTATTPSISPVPPNTAEVFRGKAITSLAKKGFDRDLVTIATARIADWARVKNIRVESAAYFEKGAKNSLLNDLQESAECQRIVGTRSAAGEAMDLPLRAHERRESTNLEVAADEVRRIRLRFPTLDYASQTFDLKEFVLQEGMPCGPSFLERVLKVSDATPCQTPAKRTALAWGGR
jgi:hypothetical protein